MRMNRCFQLILLTGVVAGCDNYQSTKSQYEPPRLIVVSPIISGPRPDVINGAKFLSASDFHHAYLRDETVVCVEGLVVKVGSIMGAPFVYLRCEKCDDAIYCEGSPLGRYQIPVGSNVVVSGRMRSLQGLEYRGRLADANLVNQSQIDDALKASNELPE